MKKILFVSILIPILVSCVSDESFRRKHPLAQYSPAAVRNGEIKQVSLEHLSNYAKQELEAPNEKLIDVMNAKYKDFGLPGKLPDNPELMEFLSYTADHYRVSYLHLGKEPCRYNLRFLWVAGALRNLWIYHGSEKAREKYVIIMKHALRNIEKMSDEEIRSKIDETGLKNFWHPLMKSASLYYARLYEATDDEHYAHRTCLILERFGEVVDKWKVYYQRGSQDKRNRGELTLDKPVPIKTKYGLWGYWGDVHDLKHAQPLPEAYQLVKHSKTFRELPEKRKKIIVDDLLHGLVRKHLLFTFRILHNQSMNRINGMITFGKILEEPEYIHIAVRWINEILHIGYRRDGFWCEGTISYAIGVTRGIFKAAQQLEGYSDPVGYVDPVDGTRFDNFSVEKEFGIDFSRIKNAFDLLVLPDGRSIALEDTTWNATGVYFTTPPTEAKPFLLGAAKVGMLGFGKDKNQTRFYLHWEGLNGHDHLDMLGMALWACGEEVSSETGYRGMHQWNISTAAHNTVVIDERNQDCAYNRIKGGKDKIYLYPHYKFAELWGGGRSCFDEGGRLVLWNTTQPDVQVAELNGDNAYAKTIKNGIYRRSLALVKVDKTHFYIVDVFRVRGGKTHDWMLHGNLAKRYNIELSGINRKITPKQGKIGKFLENLRGTKWDKNFTIDFKEKQSPVYRSIMVGNPRTEVIIADGPSIRLEKEPSSWGRPGKPSPAKIPSKLTSEFLCVRRQGPENVFVAVHEAFIDKPCVEGVELINANNPVKIKVKLKDCEDIIESSEGIIKYSGNGKTIVFGGKPFTGDVLAITSVGRGDRENSFIVSGDLPEGAHLKDEVLIVYDGEKRPHPYTISEIEKLSDGKTKIIINGETGMLLEKDLMIMTYYPSWDVAGKLTYKIPGKEIINQ